MPSFFIYYTSFSWFIITTMEHPNMPSNLLL